MYVSTFIHTTNSRKKMNVCNLFECVHTEIRKWVSLVTYMRVSYVEQVSRASTTGTQETTGPLDYWTPGLLDYQNTGLLDYQTKNPADHKPSTSLMMKMRPTWIWISSAWFDTLFNLTITLSFYQIEPYKKGPSLVLPSSIARNSSAPNAKGIFQIHRGILEGCTNRARPSQPSLKNCQNGTF